MKKYEVWVIVWSEEYGQQIKKVAGTFDTLMHAKLFKDAYNNYYSANAEIVEYVRK